MYRHWGTVDAGNKFHPNATYFYAPLSERLKLIFPKEWDLSEAEKLSGLKHRGRVAYEADDVDRQYGATWLLDRVADVTGVREDLLKAFGGNAEMVDDILTMAYFPFIDNLSYSHLAQWQREVKAPSRRKLTSTMVTRLTQDITEQNRMDLFRSRAARMGKEELCAVDSTSVSTYGFHLVDWYRELLISMRDRLQSISKFLVADAFFAKNTFIVPLLDQGFHVVSRLRNDAALWYPTQEKPTGKRGRSRLYDGKIDFANLDATRCVELHVDKG